jgi:hypothetical protein
MQVIKEKHAIRNFANRKAIIRYSFIINPPLWASPHNNDTLKNLGSSFALSNQRLN